MQQDEISQNDIVEMARQAGWEMDNSCVLSPQVLWYIYQGQLEAFAKLVADAATAKERETCIRDCKEVYRVWVCESDDDIDYPDPHDCIRAIRARGQT